jgi:Cu-Zn family superoxide dismutase
MNRSLAAAIGCVALLAGCASTPPGQSDVVVALESRSGSTVTGNVQLSESQGRVHLRATVRGLAPGSTVGFHIHEKGDCSAPDASSAGGHFNPAGAPHGRYGQGPHHAGDLPSLVANDKGEAKVDVVLEGVTLTPGDMSIANRSLVVHAKADDFTTQPTGNSGPRVACGVIKL